MEKETTVRNQAIPIPKNGAILSQKMQNDSGESIQLEIAPVTAFKLLEPKKQPFSCHISTFCMKSSTSICRILGSKSVVSVIEDGNEVYFSPLNEDPKSVDCFYHRGLDLYLIYDMNSGIWAKKADSSPPKLILSFDEIFEEGYSDKIFVKDRGVFMRPMGVDQGVLVFCDPKKSQLVFCWIGVETDFEKLRPEVIGRIELDKTARWFVDFKVFGSNFQNLLLLKNDFCITVFEISASDHGIDSKILVQKQKLEELEKGESAKFVRFDPLSEYFFVLTGTVERARRAFLYKIQQNGGQNFDFELVSNLKVSARRRENLKPSAVIRCQDKLILTAYGNFDDDDRFYGFFLSFVYPGGQDASGKPCLTKLEELKWKRGTYSYCEMRETSGKVYCMNWSNCLYELSYTLN